VTAARSLLFVPATSASKIDRAFAAGADGVIIDLEDAVAVSHKEAAREALTAIFAVPRADACVRVNAVSTPHCLLDLLALPLPAVSTVVLPKVQSAADLAVVDWVLRQRETSCGLAAGSIALLALIETAKGLREVDAIARAAPRLRRLAFGAVDFATDLGTAVEEDSVVSAARVALACASRAAGLEPPIDAPELAMHHDDRLRAAAVRAKAQGFAGKLCIHPAQIGIVNQTFSPTVAEVERARQIVAAFERAEREGVAALSVDGEMVDYPVVERARRTLSLAQPLATNRKA
jgi:citrate lyase subunit beta/citryl-CoA lyase